jgi:hypothetical protein
MKQYRHRRSANPANAFPNPLEPGELAVNTANRQLAVGDANAGSVGVPLPLLAIRYFDARASYAAGDMVVQAGKLYTANAAVPPGAFNGSQWTEFTGGGGTATDPTKVLKTGDTMSGHLFLPTGPAAANAVRRDYVDAADLVLTNAINNKSSLTVSDTPPASPTDGQLWWESDSGMLYVRYNDGVGPAQWVQAVAVPSFDPTAFVARAGDTMFGHLSLPTTPAAANAVRKDYVDSAIASAMAAAVPFDALAYNGMQINGGFTVNQEGAGTVLLTGHAGDSWFFSANGIPGARATVDNTAPVLGFSHRIYSNTATGKATLVTSDYSIIQQSIEGYRMSRLGWGFQGASPITIAFWSEHTVPGTYSISIRNGLNNRSYVATYTQNVGGTREYKTVTIPGDTGGQWDVLNTSGIVIAFCSACGPTYTAPTANVWAAGNYLAAPGQVNSLNATAQFMMLRGVSILPGAFAPTAAQSPLIIRPFDQELVTCQRYYQRSTQGNLGNTLFWSGYANAGASYYVSSPFRPYMRAVPVMSYAVVALAGFPSAQPSSSSPGIEGVWISAVPTADTAGAYYEYSYKADARL